MLCSHSTGHNRSKNEGPSKSFGEACKVLVRETPADTDKFILNWLYCIKNNGNKELVIGNARLNSEVQRFRLLLGYCD